MSLGERIARHRRFWSGAGPSLILIPAEHAAQYDVADYRRRFEDPRLMWEAEMRRARPLLDWPTDGIPTVRPNLGVVFVPVLAGQDFEIREGQMPWPGKPLERDAIRAARARDLASAELMRRSERFYAIHRSEGGGEIAAYHPDTQSVFDVAHLLDGTGLFYEVYDEPEWVHELLEICLELFVAATRRVKALICESDAVMIHGHGTPQGIHFPDAGARTSEDTATLLSPGMIGEFVLPYTERALEPFGGGFVHFCGHHPALFERLCSSAAVRAIDLGNSEAYDPRWLFERCAESGTALYSRIAALPGEDWRSYVRRLGGLVAETGARCVLRPMVYPETREECREMRQIWHSLTEAA